MSADMGEWKDANLGVRKQLKSCISRCVPNTHTRDITSTNQTIQFSRGRFREQVHCTQTSGSLPSDLITLDLTILLPHCFSTRSRPNWDIYRIVWLHSISCVHIRPRFLLSVIVSKLYSPHDYYLNLWSLRFCFKAGKGQSFGDKFPWYNHNKCRLFS